MVLSPRAKCWLRGGVGAHFPGNLNWFYYFPKSIWHHFRIVALTGPGGGIYSSSSGTLSTAGRCKKTPCTVYRVPYRVRSQSDPDKFFAVSDYFHGYFLVRKNILLWRVILFLSFSRVKKVKSLMFLELIFHAHHARLNEGFILGAYRSVFKYQEPTTIGGVALMKLVLLFCLFVTSETLAQSPQLR